MTGVPGLPDQDYAVPGITRVADLSPLFYFSPIGLAEMSGAELAEAAKRFGTGGGSPLILCTSAEIKASALRSDSMYRVAFPTSLLWRFSAEAKMAPRNFEYTDLSVDEALARGLVAPGE